MIHEPETSDDGLLDLLRQRGALSVTQLAQQTKVTATAVRQRLNRLLARGDITRQVAKKGRGRPSHQYGITDQGRKRSGTNFSDLAIALWEEVREIKDPEIRRGLLQRLATRLAGRYSSRLEGKTLRERMTSLAQVFTDRKIPFEVDPTTDESKGELPMLRALACPYPDLAEQDRSVCSLEKMLFSELLGENMRLAECRLDGGNCCTFQPAFG